MNLILGGGLTALLARDILGSQWSLVPIGRSRYYSYNPPLSDNYIPRDNAILEYIKQFYIMPVLCRAGYSYAGQIIFGHTIALNPYLNKLYANNVPPHAYSFMASSQEYFGCGDCLDIYKILNTKYKDEILANDIKYGKPVNIKDHIVTTSTGNKLEYDRIVSTVPLTVLLEWMGITWINLSYRDLYYYHIRTDCLDFEGATKLYVVDPEIEFHVASMLNKENYIFAACKQIKYPGRYFMPFMRRFDLIAETSVSRSICCGPLPSIPELKSAGITCIGSTAAHDDYQDIARCIKLLIRMA